MTESKKAWVKPELIVLVRSKPEEAILGACKGGSTDISNLTFGGYACGSLAPICANCTDYSAS